MIIVEFNDPLFVAMKDIVLHTKGGDLHLEAGEPVGLRKSQSGSYYIGDRGDILELKTTTVFNDLMSSIKPCRFSLGESEMVESVLMEDMDAESTIARIPLSTRVHESTLTVDKVRAV